MNKKSVFIIVLALLCTLVVGAVGFVGYRTVSKPNKLTYYPVKADLPLTRENLLVLVNEERVAVGVQPLIMDERLNKSAQRKADDMMQYDYYGHLSPHDGKQGYEYIFDEMGDYCKWSSENILRGTGENYNLNATDAFDGWKGSPAHYAAMIDPKNTLTGFGIVKDNESVKVVEHFCQP